MNKELQDLAWAILPKEFKEDVRTIYAATMRMVDKRESAEQIYVNKLSTLEGIFGFDNLTSDAEGKGMLTCEKSKVQRLYAEQSDFRDQKDDCLWKDYEVRDVILMVLQELFGSKCLPDELRENNFAKSDAKEDNFASKELKFKVGDKVRVKGCGYEPNLHKGDIGEILDTNDKEQCFVLFKKSQAWIYTDCLEPYTEPTENPIPSNSGELKSQLPDNQLRLKIAAMAMQGLLANSHQELVDMKIEQVAQFSFEMADSLIDKSKKGGCHE